jgi:hypothetical protein
VLVTCLSVWARKSAECGAIDRSTDWNIPFSVTLEVPEGRKQYLLDLKKVTRSLQIQ